MGNKASGCAASGFIQDNTVKDLHSEVTKETPEPRFAIVGTPIKVRYKSLNDPEDSIMVSFVKNNNTLVVHLSYKIGPRKT